MIEPSRKTTDRGIGCALQRGFVAAAILAAVRTAFAALKDDYFGDGLLLLGVRSAARDFPEHLLLAVLPLALLAGAASRIAYRRDPLRLVFVPLLVAAGLGYLWASFRLPEATWYRPGTEGTRAYAAHAVAGIAALVAAAALGPHWRRSTRERGALAVVLLLLLSWGGAWLLRDAAGSTDERPNVILVSLDTLRADRLGCYGYSAPTSPELDRFAERALLFDHAFTPEPWTLTAHATLLTGLTPSVHGANHDRGIAREARPLAEYLGDEGMLTLAVVDRVEWFEPRYGMARGFDYYRQMPDDAEMKVDRILDLLDDIGDARFFLLAHFYDAHSDWRRLPYEARDEDVAEIVGGYREEFTGCDDDELCGSKRLLAMPENGRALSVDELEYTSRLYDAGVRSLDREVGRLLRGLEARGRMRDTVILVTADHGEEFFDHGRYLHGQNFDECVRVPLLLYTPDAHAGRSDEMVGLVDVPATLLELAEAQPAPTQGISFAPLVRGELLAAPRDYLLLENRRAELGIRSRDWSYLVLEARADDPTRALFDHRFDPGQEQDLLGAEPGEPTAALLDAADAILDREAAAIELLRRRFGATGEAVELSAEELERLDALGYGGLVSDDDAE